MRKAVRQAAKAVSFKDASEDLQELAGVSISPTHLQRLSERIGSEWLQVRDAEVVALQTRNLPRDYGQAAAVAAVMLDGGRYQTRAEKSGRGVTAAAWKESKAACCQTYASSPCRHDPQPRPPRKFLDRAQVARLTMQMAGSVGGGRRAAAAAQERPGRRRRGRKARRRRRLVRTVVATTADNDRFGWQVAAEVHRRGLDQAGRKACLGDGSKAIWALFELHLLGSGFIGILDFLHLLGHLYAAACAVEGKGTEAAWVLYTQWLCWAWSGEGLRLLSGLRAACRQVGVASAGSAEDDPRKVVADTLGYVLNNRGRMDYPRYRKLGLPISSAPVESVIKQLNRRVKGSEKFWLKVGAEAILQVRAAYLSEDGRAERYWARPRPYARAVGGGRLRRVAAPQ